MQRQKFCQADKEVLKAKCFLFSFWIECRGITTLVRFFIAVIKDINPLIWQVYFLSLRVKVKVILNLALSPVKK